MFALAAVLPALLLSSCGDNIAPADLLILNGRVYTLAWPDPAADGTPDEAAPHAEDGWTPEAQAVAIRDGRIVFVGSADDAKAYQGDETQVLDVWGGTVLPGLIDSHVHIANLGQALDRVNLVDARTPEQAIARVAERAQRTPEGEWIVGWGWDEGAWANAYPTMRELSRAVPKHPVVLLGLHSFAAWGNQSAFEKAGIDGKTASPQGGHILKDRRGRPTGILLNNATRLLSDALPARTAEQRKADILRGLEAMAQAGYVAIHEAGADSGEMAAFQALEQEGKLSLRVHAMLSLRDEDLLDDWRQRGPDGAIESRLVTRSVKAFYDGALGSRGAKLLEDYSDRKGHRGVSGADYGFDAERLESMMAAGFQAAVHAIGDAANRETLDFFEGVYARHPEARKLRNRIEHAQVLSPQDIPRFASLDIIASMQPPHAVEDKTWAQDRLGSDRIRGAYAWRSLRMAGARLVFNSDLPGSDHNFFYGLHSALTRRGKDLLPANGWYPEQCLTVEETLRAYTIWAAYAGFEEADSGSLEVGKRGDITILDIDPLVIGSQSPDKLLEGRIVATIVGGHVLYENF